MSKLWTLICVIVGVSVASVLFGWMMFRFAKSMDRAERDPKHKRRILLRSAAIYGFGIVLGVSQVVTGDAPLKTLLALPIPLLIVWMYLRAARQVKTPPGQDV